MELIDQLRLMQVKRYPISYMNRDQSVAEHSFGVALIVMELTKTLRDRELAEAALEYALVHDAEEVYTGDIPSSFKRVLREHAPNVSVLLDGRQDNIPDEVKAVVKLADYLEAIYYLREFGGSRLSRDVVLKDILLNFKSALAKLPAPESVIARAIELEAVL